MSQIGKDASETKDRDNATSNEAAPSNPSKQQSFRNSINLDKNGTQTEDQVVSFQDNDRKDQQLLINGSDAKRSISPQKGAIKNNID